MNADRRWDVLVIGAGGNQSQAMLEAAARINPLTKWLCADLSWRPDRREFVEGLGATTIEFDALGDVDKLNELVTDVQVVANMVGPYFRTIGLVFEACAKTGTNYLDICDDADATEFILNMDGLAKRAGITALTGMGASPGTTNILIRAALDALGSADDVAIHWINDARDSSPATLEHLWHIFRPYRDGRILDEVPKWEDLQSKEVEFADSVGTHLTMELAHSELVSVPKFLDVKKINNYGGVAPADSLILGWAMARLGAGNRSLPGQEIDDLLKSRYALITEARHDLPRIKGGLRIDVVRGNTGLSFQSASEETMEESTGTPAAAGIYALLNGQLPQPGVIAPECMEPAIFFDWMSKLSKSSGSMSLYEISDGKAGQRLSLRELVTAPSKLAEKLGRS